MMYGPLADVKKKKIVLESLFDIPNFHLIYIKVVYKERYRYEISIFLHLSSQLYFATLWYTNDFPLIKQILSAPG